MNKILKSKLEEIIANKIHIIKCNVGGIPPEAWKALDGQKIAQESIAEIAKVLEAWAYLPCCHTSGMHNPEHFAKSQFICSDQKAEAFERLCKELDINPVTKSRPDCHWCREYLHYRTGEGKPLFEEEK